MIARIWHGTTDADKADEYVDYVKRTGLADYRTTKGNCGAYILRKIEGGTAHFYTLSFWDSLDSIKEFAGEDYEKARYYAEDKKFLLEFEETVRHLEVFD